MLTDQMLGTFLYNNYSQALDILMSEPMALSHTMQELGLTSTTTFDDWLAEECAYLKALTKEPLVETLQMEYYQKLVNLRATK